MEMLSHHGALIHLGREDFFTGSLEIAVGRRLLPRRARPREISAAASSTHKAPVGYLRSARARAPLLAAGWRGRGARARAAGFLRLQGRGRAAAEVGRSPRASKPAAGRFMTALATLAGGRTLGANGFEAVFVRWRL